MKEAIRILEETKADKDWVRGEFERVKIKNTPINDYNYLKILRKKIRILKQKADKRDLDLKVNKKTFDENMNDVSNSINGCIAKNTSLVCFYCYLLYIMIKLMLTRLENK